MNKSIIFALVATAMVSGCGEPQATKSAEALTADKIAETLKKSGLKITDVNVVTETNDSNHLLGRPNQYTSKVYFYDARHPKGADGSDEGENTIEVFASPADAKARHDYVESVTKGVPMLLQYQVLRGPALIRFDKVMLPTEVDGYKQAISEIVE